MRNFVIGMLGIVMVATMLLTGTSCQHDTTFMDDGGINPIDTTTMGGNPCDPGKVYFDMQILPILVSNCAFSGCHNAASHQDGVVLTDYESVMQTGKVRPFRLGESDLYEVITENDAEDRMPPPPRSGLTSAQINLIAAWIQQGALDLSCDANAGNCNLDNVTFSGTIRPILQNACVGCHGGTAPSGNIDLSTHSGAAAVAINGKLYGAVSHAAGFQAMPQGGQRLAQCAIDQIKAWADAGAPNN